MSRSYDFYKDHDELNEEEVWRKKQLEEERQYYLEQERLLNDEELPQYPSEIPYSEEELFMDIEEDERNFIESGDIDLDE